MTIITLEDKLPKPDFEGEWKNFGGSSGNFKLYVLRKFPFSSEYKKMLDIFELDMLGKQAEIIEGVIVDDFGLAIFNGSRGNIGIEFYKNYSTRALSRGGTNNLFYYGFVREATGCDKSELKKIESIPRDISLDPDSAIRYEGEYTALGRRASLDENALGTFWMKKVE